MMICRLRIFLIIDFLRLPLAPRGAKNRRHEVEELDEVKINLLPLGLG
jgi:hypothetical protein